MPAQEGERPGPQDPIILEEQPRTPGRAVEDLENGGAAGGALNLLLVIAFSSRWGAAAAAPLPGAVALCEPAAWQPA